MLLEDSDLIINKFNIINTQSCVLSDETQKLYINIDRNYRNSRDVISKNY